MLQTQTPVRRWKQWLVLPVLGGLFLIAGRSASAQATPPPPPKPLPAAQANATSNGVYTYVEQMPELPGGGATKAIIEQLMSKLIYPEGGHEEGIVFASFVVGATGDVRDAKIIKGLTQPYDEAVLTAVRKLPRFIPGKQGGRAVAVSFTVPVRFKEKP